MDIEAIINPLNMNGALSCIVFLVKVIVKNRASVTPAENCPIKVKNKRDHSELFIVHLLLINNFPRYIFAVGLMWFYN